MFGLRSRMLLGLGAGCGVAAHVYRTEQPRAFFFGQPAAPCTKQIRKEIVDLLDDDIVLGPQFVRLAWHAAGTFDRTKKDGGNHGTMDKEPENSDGANAGLAVPRAALAPVLQRNPGISKADLWVLASLIAIEEMSGPKIPFFYGRQDGSKCPPVGRLPDASQAQDHIRKVFTGQYGFNDKETVALIGAHALGRCNKDRSGYDGPWTFDPYTFSNNFFIELLEKTWVVNPATKGTANEQYQDAETKQLMMLPADLALIKDPVFLGHVKEYAADNDRFLADFSKAYAKLMNLGWEGQLKGPTTDY